jgi:hypothetical protein
MTYGQPPGAAAAAAAAGQAASAAGSAASAAQVAKAQQQSFTLATNASKLVGPPVEAALVYVNSAVPQISGAVMDLERARSALAPAATTFSEMGALTQWFVTYKVGNHIGPHAASALSNVTTAYNLVQAYEVDAMRVLQSVTRIRYTLQRMTFNYRDTPVGKYDVKSCSNLRQFKTRASSAKSNLGSIYRDLYQIRETLYSYGSLAGRQRRNQTKQLMTNAKLAVNEAMTALTQMARSGVIVKNIRRGIDITNSAGHRDQGPCGSYYRGSGPTPEGWNDSQAAYCRGLNTLEMFFKLVAAKQGRSWTNYRMRWNSLSNSDKERNIVTGLTEFREQVLRPMRNRTIPNAREDFVDAFKGMSDVIGKRRSEYTAAQYNALGKAAKAALQLTDVMNDVRKAEQQSNSLALPLAVIGDLSPVQCQFGSGYAGLFSSDDGEPMDPMLLVGGGLMAGVAVAHFFPNLLRS